MTRKKTGVGVEVQSPTKEPEGSALVSKDVRGRRAPNISHTKTGKYIWGGPPKGEVSAAKYPPWVEKTGSISVGKYTLKWINEREK